MIRFKFTGSVLTISAALPSMAALHPGALWILRVLQRRGGTPFLAIAPLARRARTMRQDKLNLNWQIAPQKLKAIAPAPNRLLAPDHHMKSVGLTRVIMSRVG